VKWAEAHPAGTQFVDWFRCHAATVIKDCMLRPLREQCQLGSPPEYFYSNGNESMNKPCQKWCKDSKGAKQLDLGEATSELRNLVAQRQMDVEDAVFGSGPFKVIPKYH
jgi:hypothetical protein